MVLTVCYKRLWSPPAKVWTDWSTQDPKISSKIWTISKLLTHCIYSNGKHISLQQEILTRNEGEKNKIQGLKLWNMARNSDNISDMARNSDNISDSSTRVGQAKRSQCWAWGDNISDSSTRVEQAKRSQCWAWGALLQHRMGWRHRPVSKVSITTPNTLLYLIWQKSSRYWNGHVALSPISNFHKLSPYHLVA